MVALTAATLDEDQHRCIEAGMVDFVGKPFSIREIERALKAAYDDLAPRRIRVEEGVR